MNTINDFYNKMSYFTQIPDLPIYDLYSELNHLLKHNVVHWNDDNQICINTLPDYSDNYTIGTGSLTLDWSTEYAVDENGYKTAIVKEKNLNIKESDFTILCSKFSNTKFELIYNELSTRYKLGRLRLMKSSSKTCLSWHRDHSYRIHYPLKTQEGCLMIIEDEVIHLTKDTWWMTNTTVKHTALNASREDRIHLVAVILEKY